MASTSGGQSTYKEIPTFSIESSLETSYAAVTQKHTIKRDQGIILDCLDGLNLSDYASAIGELVEKKNVISASRISNNRICIYVSTKELVNEITGKYEYIVINENKVTLRPLVSRHKRVIFSNVPSEVPNFVFEKILNELNVKCASPITTLRAAINVEGFNHVQSFRRQVYVKPEDVIKIPEVFKVNFENFDYIIFASTDVLRCFICKLEGHLARHCTNTDMFVNSQTIDTDNNINNSNINENSEMFNLINNGEIESASPYGLNNIIKEKLNENNTNTETTIGRTLINKRSYSDISSSQSSTGKSPNPDYKPNKIKPIIKKNKADAANQITETKNLNKVSQNENEMPQGTNDNKRQITPSETNIDDSTETDELDKKLITIKNYLDQSDSLLNYFQFKSLLENTKGIKNPIDIVLQYTEDLQSFTKFIKEDIYPNIRNTSIRQRCTRLLNKINNPQFVTPDQTPDNSDFE